MTKENISLIEYAAYFGSTQIYRYLNKNCVEISSYLWFYAIDGCDEEIIHNIEGIIDLEKDVLLANYYFYIRVLRKAIKSHNSYVTNYIKDTLMIKKDIPEEKSMLYCLKYYNFINFDLEKINNINGLFQYACGYDYYLVVKHLLNTKNIEYDDEALYYAAKNDNSEVLSLLLCLIKNEIKKKLFQKLL